LAVQYAPGQETEGDGIVRSLANDLQVVQGLVEKPGAEQALSALAVAGRYILCPSMSAHLSRQQGGTDGEIHLTDAIAAKIDTESIHALRYPGARHDYGSKLGYLQATRVLGKQHPEVGAEFARWLGKR
jgi:UTP--glucose-1-phosphate uridylyltransferase